MQISQADEYSGLIVRSNFQSSGKQRHKFRRNPLCSFILLIQRAEERKVRLCFHNIIFIFLNGCILSSLPSFNLKVEKREKSTNFFNTCSTSGIIIIISWLISSFPFLLWGIWHFKKLSYLPRWFNWSNWRTEFKSVKISIFSVFTHFQFKSTDNFLLSELLLQPSWAILTYCNARDISIHQSTP